MKSEMFGFLPRMEIQPNWKEFELACEMRLAMACPPGLLSGEIAGTCWNHMELSVSYSIILYPKRLGKEICLKPLGKVVGSVPLTVCKVSGPHSGCVACLWKMQMEV